MPFYCFREILIHKKHGELIMNNQKPEIVYKYCSLESAERIIKDKQIKLTALSDVNDPFEALPQKSTYFKNRKSADELLNRTVQRQISDLIHDGKTMEAAQFYHDIQNNDWVAEVIQDATQNFNIMEMAQYIRKSIFCTCFSTTYDNILMWSHYADQHRGCCIAFKTDNLNLRQVEYVDKRPLVCSDDIKSKMKFILKKHTNWSYEREWRYLKVAPEISKNNLPIFLPIGDSIVAVYFGARSKDFNKLGQFDKVRSSIAKPIKKFIAKADDMEYKLVFDEYKL